MEHCVIEYRIKITQNKDYHRFGGNLILYHLSHGLSRPQPGVSFLPPSFFLSSNDNHSLLTWTTTATMPFSIIYSEKLKATPGFALPKKTYPLASVWESIMVNIYLFYNSLIRFWISYYNRSIPRISIRESRTRTVRNGRNSSQPCSSR